MMAFELYGEQEWHKKECFDMFRQLKPGVYAKSTLPATTIRRFAKEYGIKVSVRADGRSFDNIVRIKPLAPKGPEAPGGEND